jgi:hypothetical protein
MDVTSAVLRNAVGNWCREASRQSGSCCDTVTGGGFPLGPKKIGHVYFLVGGVVN